MADEPKPEKPVIAITSLDAFAPSTVNVTLEFDDHIESVPMRTLSHAEFQQIGYQVPNPKPPISGVDGNRRPVLDYEDATYKLQMQQAETERSYRRLLASLELDIPGDTEDEKLDYLKALDANRVWLLMSAVGQLVTEGRAKVEAKSATFHGRRKADQ